MRISDYIGQAGTNLWKKKLRTFPDDHGCRDRDRRLVCMFAFGQGIQRNITDQFKELDLFNYINVSVAGRPGRHHRSFDPDDPRAAPPDQADEAAASSGAEPNAPVLNVQFLEELKSIPGVEAAFPEMRFPAQIRIGKKGEFTMVQVLPANVYESGLVQLRAGTCYVSDEPNELVVSDTLLRRLGVTDFDAAVGMDAEVATLTMDFSLTNLLRMAFQGGGGGGLPIARESYRFKIVGVAERMGFGGPLPIRSDAYVPPGRAAGMQKLSLTSVWDLFQPGDGSTSYSMVSVKVKSPQDVAPMEKVLQARGYRTFALMDQLDQMRIGFLIMDMFLLAVGMIGITVASLGIVNTMVMSILERYREIGIMKAVGATDGDVQRIFLFESGAIGLLGGVIGLLLAAAVSLVINEVINAFMARQRAPRMAYFSFPWWLCMGAVTFSILVSLLAGIYPTRRAARVDPVVALRHD